MHTRNSPGNPQLLFKRTRYFESARVRPSFDSLRSLRISPGASASLTAATRLKLITADDSNRLWFDHIQANPLNATTEAEHAGGAVAQVHDPPFDVGPAVIDPDDDPLPILQIRDLHISSEGKLAMGRGELEHVKILAAGRGSAMKLLSVPGGNAHLVRFLLYLGSGGLPLRRAQFGRLGKGLAWSLGMGRNWSRRHVGSQYQSRRQTGQYSVHANSF